MVSRKVFLPRQWQLCLNNWQELLQLPSSWISGVPDFCLPVILVLYSARWQCAVWKSARTLTTRSVLALCLLKFKQNTLGCLKPRRFVPEGCYDILFPVFEFFLVGTDPYSAEQFCSHKRACGDFLWSLLLC